jgi:hypothetical protein
MFGKRDIDWCHEFQGEEYTNLATNLITTMRNIGFLIYDEIPQCVDYKNFTEKKNNAKNIIISHYHMYHNAPLYMIIEGT